MKKQLNHLFAILALLFAFNAEGQNFVRADKSNSGQSFQITQEQVLEINLPRRPSTGYIWVESSASADKAIQRSVEKIGDDEWISDPTPLLANGTHMVGQSGTQVIRYVGTSQGTTVLTFELKRPWEKNNPPMDYFTVTIVSGGKYTGTYTPPAKKVFKHKTSNPVTNSIPTHFDWRSKCTPVENQGSCGDCWAYATVGCFEANIQITDNITRDLSEEFVTDCYTVNSNGCSGGNCAFDCWLATYSTSNPQGGGAVYESDDVTTCNSTGNTGTCSSAGHPHHEVIDSHAFVPNGNANGIPPDADIKNAIYNYGPIWMAFDAASSAFSNYSGGILTESGTSVDHAVCFVGYVDSASVPGGGYWIVRNSWGSGWGMGGYFYLSYGSDACGTDAQYLVYKGGVPHAALDAGIASVVYPNGTTCNTTFSPVIKLQNFGATTLTSCKILYHVDANPNQTFNWTGSLATGISTSVTLPSITTTAGTHTFTSASSAPNNGTDGNTGNDQNQSTFNISSVASSIPLMEGFESSANLPATWSINNPDNDAAWQVVTTLGHNSSQCIGMNNCNGDGSTDMTGKKDRFITTTYNFSSANSGTGMTFDVGYIPAFDGTKLYTDTLAVFASKDCGTTWSQIYIKGGTQLATGPQFTISTSLNCVNPTASQWRTEAISLSSYAGQPNVMFAFENRSDWGNWVYIDNINLNAQANGIASVNSADGFSIYPNPATTYFTIDGLSDAEKVHYSIFNVVGAEVQKGDIATSGNTFNGKIQVNNISSGMYFIRVTDGKNTWTKKLNVQ